MPIEGTRQYILQAVKMIELLEPNVLIPTHYWSQSYKQEFLNEIERQFNEKEKAIQVIGVSTSSYTYHKTGSDTGLLIPNLIQSERK